MEPDAVGASTYHLAVRSAEEEDADDRVIFALDQRRAFSDDESLHERHTMSCHSSTLLHGATYQLVRRLCTRCLQQQSVS